MGRSARVCTYTVGVALVPAAVRLSEAIDQYLDTMKAQGQSPTTIKCKRSALLRFLGIVGNIYPKNLTPRHVDEFLVAHPHWSPSTKKLNLTYVSKFVDWMKGRRYVDRHMDLIESRARSIRVPRKNRERIHPSELMKFLHSVKNPRDRIVVALGIFALLRSSEIRLIQWKDVDLKDDWLDIWREKTDEWDRLPISAMLHAELERWREEVCWQLNVQEPHPEWYVTCAQRAGRGLDEKGRSRFDASLTELVPERPLKHPGMKIKQVLAGFGIEGRGVSMHTLRRSGATALLEALERGVYDESAMRVVQAMLGHRNLSTTELYLDKMADRSRRDFLIRGKVLYGPGGDYGAEAVSGM